MHPLFLRDHSSPLRPCSLTSTRVTQNPDSDSVPTGTPLLPWGPPLFVKTTRTSAFHVNIKKILTSNP